MIAIGVGFVLTVAGYIAAASSGLANGRTTLVLAAIAVSAFALTLYHVTSSSWTHAGRALAAAGSLWILWLLLASGTPAAFAVGWLFAALVVPLIGLEILGLATESAYLRSERVLLLASSVTVAICWSYLALTSRQPALLTPLVKCAPACPRNVLFVGSLPGTLATVAQEGVRAGWLIATFGVALFVARRFRTMGAVAQRRCAPILIVAIAYTAAVSACVALQAAAWDVRAPLAWVSVVTATALPLAALAGLAWERLFMGHALEEFVNGLGDTAPGDLRALMAQVLHDPSVQIGYSRSPASGYTDPSGVTIEMPDPGADQGVTTVHREGLQEAVVIHRGAVAEQERFIHAAGAAALISSENHRLTTDLSASVVELAASRTRLVGAANAERQRIERDLHDGIQQRIVGARVKLELADDALDANPPRGRRMLAEIGCDMDDAVEEIRSLAQGVYPALLETHGLVEALRAVARRAPGPVTVRGDIARYPADTEAAVYFCCLETLQNVAKHAGREAIATVRLWEEGSVLRFQTRDSGVGFTPNGTALGQGLINMRDRLGAVGGNLTLTSRAGDGTVVGGCVPLA
jgi:signal transduction histidine kinase